MNSYLDTPLTPISVSPSGEDVRSLSDSEDMSSHTHSPRNDIHEKSELGVCCQDGVAVWVEGGIGMSRWGA